MVLGGNLRPLFYSGTSLAQKDRESIYNSGAYITGYRMLLVMCLASMKYRIGVTVGALKLCKKLLSISLVIIWIRLVW